METIKELENWIEENNIKNTYTPNFRYVSDEGLGLEDLYGTYVWYFNERGIRSDLRIFKTEKETVEFVFEYLNKHERQI